MRTSRGNRTGALEVRARYTIVELANAANVSHQSMRRLLAALGVEVLRVGRSAYVLLSEIEEKLEPLWKSIVAAESVRAAASANVPTVTTSRRPARCDDSSSVPSVLSAKDPS